MAHPNQPPEGDAPQTPRETLPDLPVPKVVGQPVAALVPEERGVARVHAFARRWRALRFQQERGREQLAPHDLCGVSCTGLTSRCVRQMEREGFLCAVR